jgi:hypothetical protein
LIGELGIRDLGKGQGRARESVAPVRVHHRPGRDLAREVLLHEANEVWNYYSCMSFEGDSRLKSIWERFLDYELGQFHHVLEIFKRQEGRDASELIPKGLPEPIQYKSQRDFVRQTLREIPFRAQGTEIGDFEDSAASVDYREQLNSNGSPSNAVSAGWRWHPGGELSARAETGQRARDEASQDRRTLRYLFVCHVDLPA